MLIIFIVYAVFLLGLAVFGGSAVYHAVRFGFPGDRTKAAILVYLGTVTVIVIASLIAIGTIDFAEVTL